MSADPQSFTWYEVWGLVYLTPSEQSFKEILADPKSHVNRAFLWTLISGAIAAFIVSLANTVGGLSYFEQLLISFSLGILVGPIVALLALVLISIPIVHGSGQFDTEQEKDRFIYCVAAALDPALLAYSFLIAIGSLLAKLSLDLSLVLNILAVFVTAYLFWLLKMCFHAATKQGPEMPRGIMMINKSLALNSIILALVPLAYCAIYYLFLEIRKSPSIIDFWLISLIALGFLIYFGVRVLSDLIERQSAKQLAVQGQVTDGKILKIWVDQWFVSVSSGNEYTLEPKYAYYITLEYSVAEVKHVIQRKITNDEYMRLAEGSPIKIRYLLDEPETVQLMPE
jgi:hypothetical protein